MVPRLMPLAAWQTAHLLVWGALIPAITAWSLLHLRSQPRSATRSAVAALHCLAMAISFFVLSTFIQESSVAIPLPWLAAYSMYGLVTAIAGCIGLLVLAPVWRHGRQSASADHG